MKCFEDCKTISDYIGRFLYLITTNGFSSYMDRKLGLEKVE